MHARRLLFSLSLTTLVAAGASAQERQELVTIVTSPDPQTQLMAMVLTMNAAPKATKSRILLCGPAADIALKNAPASATAGQPPRNMSPQGLMKMVREKAGTAIDVCAIYLPGKGLDKSALIEGVGVADPAEIGGALVTSQTRVLSF